MLDATALKALPYIVPASRYYLNSNGLISNIFSPRLLSQDEKRYTIRIDQVFTETTASTSATPHPDRQDPGHSHQPHHQRRRV